MPRIIYDDDSKPMGLYYQDSLTSYYVVCIVDESGKETRLENSYSAEDAEKAILNWWGIYK